MSTDLIQKRSNKEMECAWSIPESPRDPFVHFIRNFFTEQNWFSLLKQDRTRPYRIVETCFHFSPRALIHWGHRGSAPLDPLHYSTFLTDCQLSARAIYTLFVPKEERMDKDFLTKNFIHFCNAYPGVAIQDLHYPRIIPLLQTPEKRGEEFNLDLYLPMYKELSAPFFDQIDEKINELQKSIPATREELFALAVEESRYDFNEFILSQLEHELFKKTLSPKVILIHLHNPNGSSFHVFAIEILPAEEDFPQQYRIYQSFLNCYTLSDHLQRYDSLLDEEQMKTFFTSFRVAFRIENREDATIARELERCFGVKISYFPPLLHFNRETRYLGGLSLSFTLNTLKNPFENAMEFLQEQVHCTTLASLIAERILEINTYSQNRSSMNYLRVLFDLYRLLKQVEEGGDLSYSELAHQLEETYRGFLPFPTSLYRIERSTSEFFAFARAQFSPALPENATFEEIYSYTNKHYENMIQFQSIFGFF